MGRQLTYGKESPLDCWEQKADGSRGNAKRGFLPITRDPRGSAAAVFRRMFAQGLMGPRMAPVPEPETYAGMLLAGLPRCGWFLLSNGGARA